MANIGTVEGSIRLNDAFTGPLKAAQSQLAQFQSNLNGLTNNIRPVGAASEKAGNSLSKFGQHIRNTLLHVGTAVVAFKTIGAAIDSVGKQVEFTRTLTKIANVTGITRAELAQFKSELDGLRGATGRGPQELAEGFYAIASSGHAGAEATKILTNSAKLAAIGLGETNTISRALSSAINAYGKENLSAAQAADQLLAAVRAGGAEATEMGSVIGRILAPANLLGISFAEVGASIATFTRLGVRADEAVTALRGTMMALLNPSVAGEKALNAMGSSMAELRAEVREKGLAAALIDLLQATKGNVEAITDIIPNSRALAGTLANVGSQADAYRKILDEVTGSQGDVNRAMEDTKKAVSFRWDALKAQFEALSLVVGGALLPGVEALGKALSGVDPGTLQELGSDASKALSGLAVILKAVVDNLHILKAALVAFLAYKTGIIVAGWAAAYQALTYNITLAAAATTGLASRFAAAAGPIGAITLVIFALNEQLKKYVRDSQAEIDRLVASTNQAGAALQRLTSLKHGGTVTFTEYQQMKVDLDAVAESVRQLSRARDDLNKKAQTAGPDQAIVLREQAKARQDDVQAAIAHRDAIAASIKVASAQNLITRDFVATVTPIPTIINKLTDAESSFAKRVAETNTRLQDQLEVARALAAEANTDSRRRIAGPAGELAVLNNQVKLSQEKRIQLAIDKAINALDTDKLRLTAAQRANITAIVTETIKAEDATRLVTAQARLLTEQWEEAADRERQVVVELTKLGREIQRQDLVQAVINLDDSERILGALVAHGREAARYVELELYYRELGVQEASQLAAFLVDIESKQERINYLLQKVGEVSKPAWQLYMDAAFSAIKAVTDVLGDSLKQFAIEGKFNWDSFWDSLKSSALDIVIDLFKEILRRWITLQVAMAATDYATKAGTGSNFKGGSNKDFLTSTATTAGTNYLTTGSMTGGVGGAGGSGGMTSAQVSTVAGYALAAYALYVVYKGFFENHKTLWASATLTSGGGVTNVAGTQKKKIAEVTAAVEGLIAGINQFLKDTDLALTEFGTVTMKKFGDMWTVIANGMQTSFRNADEAAAFAQVAAVKFGKFAESVSAFMRAAIEGSRAVNLEQLGSDISFARRLEDFGKPQFQIDLTAIFDQLNADMRRAVDLFRNNSAALAQALTALTSGTIQSLQAIRDQLTGRQLTPEEQRRNLEANVKIFNAQVKLMQAELQLRQMELKAAVERIRAIGNINRVGVMVDGADLERRTIYLRAKTQLVKAEGSLWDAQIALIEAQLAAIDAILAELPKLIISDEELEKLLRNIGRAGGSRGAADQGKDWLADRQFQFRTSQMGEYNRQVAETVRLFDEQIKAAGKDIALRTALIALRDKELQQLAQQKAQATVTNFQEFLGLITPFDRVRATAADLIKQIEDSPFGNVRKARMIGRVLGEVERQITRLSQEMAVSLLGQMVSDLEKFGADATLQAEARRHMAIIEHTLKMAHYETEIEILRAAGKLAPEVLATLDRSLNFLRSVDPTSILTGGPTGGTSGGANPKANDPDYEWVQGQGYVWIGWKNQAVADRTDAQRIRDSWKGKGGLSIVRELKQLEDELATVTRAFGYTSDVLAEHAAAVKETISRFLDPISQARRNLAFSDVSIYDQTRQRDMLISEAQSLRTRFRAGDLSVVESAGDVVTQLLEAARQVSPRGSKGFADMFTEWDAFLAEIITITPTKLGTAGNPMVVSGIAQATAIHEEQLNVLYRMERFSAQSAETLSSIDGQLSASGVAAQGAP